MPLYRDSIDSPLGAILIVSNDKRSPARSTSRTADPE